MRFLLTGHTGFKGSWFTLMLSKLGHEIHGQSLSPEPESLYNLLRINDMVSSEEFIDIRDLDKTSKYFKTVNPDVIVHLAAQSLVSKAYENPLESIEINTLGTYNVLKASQQVENLKAILVITTDKVYKIGNYTHYYCEFDPLGYTDPYGTSKAMADLLAQTWINSVAKVPVCIARAGNVIGGGDFNLNRLVPDIYRSLKVNSILEIRNPDFIRPWQFVLDCLNGYLLQIHHSLKSGESTILNFGPSNSEFKNVEYIVGFFSKQFRGLKFQVNKNPKFNETHTLMLDSNLAMTTLKWKNKFNLETCLDFTAEWYKHYLRNGNIQKITEFQLNSFLSSN